MKHKNLAREELGNIARLAQQLYDAAMAQNVYEVKARSFLLQQAVNRLEMVQELIKADNQGL